MWNPWNPSGSLKERYFIDAGIRQTPWNPSVSFTKCRCGRYSKATHDAIRTVTHVRSAEIDRGRRLLKNLC